MWANTFPLGFKLIRVVSVTFRQKTEFLIKVYRWGLFLESHRFSSLSLFFPFLFSSFLIYMFLPQAPYSGGSTHPEVLFWKRRAEQENKATGNNWWKEQCADSLIESSYSEHSFRSWFLCLGLVRDGRKQANACFKGWQGEKRGEKGKEKGREQELIDILKESALLFVLFCF